MYYFQPFRVVILNLIRARDFVISLQKKRNPRKIIVIIIIDRSHLMYNTINRLSN